MTESVIGLDDLVRDIVEHLAETDANYRNHVGTKIGAEFKGDDDVLEAINVLLLDPQTDGHFIVDLANELLTPNFSYDGDSIVSVSRQSEPLGFQP